MTEPIIRIETRDSSGCEGSAIELSKVAYWPNDPVRWSNVWLIDSDSPRGRTVMTDDQLREFATACLAALAPPDPVEAEKLDYRMQVSLITSSKRAFAVSETCQEGPSRWALLRPGTEDEFDGTVISEGECRDLRDAILELELALARWTPNE